MRHACQKRYLWFGIFYLSLIFNHRQGIQAFFFLAVYFSLPHVCLSQTASIIKRKQLWLLIGHFFAPSGRGCQHVKIVWVVRGSDRMSTQCLSYVTLICIANTRIPSYSYGLLHTGLHPPLHAFARSTLLGCTALLRFSIHLSLSADERQEKHLLPEEVVTLCGERKRKCYDKTRMKNKKPVSPLFFLKTLPTEGVSAMASIARRTKKKVPQFWCVRRRQLFR